MTERAYAHTSALLVPTMIFCHVMIGEPLINDSNKIIIAANRGITMYFMMLSFCNYIITTQFVHI